MALENSNSLNPALYPDLAQVGGLTDALQRVLDEFSADLRLSNVEGVDSPGWAFIREGARYSQVVTALNERNFNVDFWYRGVPYCSGSTPDLTEVARAAVAFHLEKASISEITTRFVWLKSYQRAVNDDRGAEVLVTERWQDLERRLALERSSQWGSLLPLVLEAAKRSELRRLLPFTSLHYLCFSRTTHYPYSHDCPLAWPLKEGLFRVVATDQRTILGEGDAERAADLLVANLPKNCGAAILGTAEDLNGPSRD